MENPAAFENLGSFFDYFSTHHHAAIVFWFLLGGLLMKLGDTFFLPKLVKPGFLKGDREKIVYFEVLLAGTSLLLIALFCKVFFKANFMWFVLSIGVIIGGLLGLLPFSFLKNGSIWLSRKKEKK